MANLWILAWAIGAFLLAVGLFVGSFRWRKRFVWLRRIVSVALVLASILIGFAWWNTPLPFPNRRAPLPSSALVYATNTTSTSQSTEEDSAVTAYQAATGQSVWSHSFPGKNILTIQVTHNLLVVVSDETTNQSFTPSDGTLLTGLNATTGQVRWQTDLSRYYLLDADGAGRSAQYQNRLYLEMAYAPDMVTTAYRLLVAVNTDTGQMLWQMTDNTLFVTNRPWQPSLATDATAIYTNSQSAQGYAIHANSTSDGKLLWLWQWTGTLKQEELLQMSVFAGPGCVLVYTTDGRLFALRATNGALLWQRRFSSGSVYGASTYRIMRLIIQGNTLYASGLGEGASLQGIGGGSMMVYALDIATGALRWQRALPLKQPPQINSVSFWISGAGLYFTLADGLLVVNNNDGLYALNPTTGAIEWKLSSTLTLYYEGELVGASFYAHQENEQIAPATNDGVLFIQALEFLPHSWFTLFSFSPGNYQPYLYAVDMSNGQPYWRTQRGDVEPIPCMTCHGL